MRVIHKNLLIAVCRFRYEHKPVNDISKTRKKKKKEIRNTKCVPSVCVLRFWARMHYSFQERGKRASSTRRSSRVCSFSRETKKTKTKIEYRLNGTDTATNAHSLAATATSIVVYCIWWRSRQRMAPATAALPPKSL